MARAEDVAVRLAISLLLARSAAAQNNNNGATTATAANNQQTTAANNNQQTNAGNNQQTNTAAATNNPPGTQATNQPTVPADLGSSVAITGVPSSTSTTGTGTGTGISSFGLSDLPTIAGYGIPTQVVPWTQGAPFMQQTNLPEGTVFIAVGAFLAFLGLCILTWRGLVAWSIHRSVKRANEKLFHQPESVKLVKPGYGGAASLAAQSNMSIDRLAASTPGNTLSKKSTTPARSNIASVTAASRNSSLFFSPTAGTGHAGTTSSTFLPTNRSSSFLPSGYYTAPGAAAPASGAPGTHIGTGSANRYSRHSRYHDVSPPGSPGLPPSSRGLESRGGGGTHGMYHQPSTSSLNLNIPGNAHPGGRAPSANLDDMLGDYPLPNAR